MNLVFGEVIEGMDVADKKRLDKLYTQAQDILTNADLNDEQRAESMNGVNKQIALIKSKGERNAQARDPELDTQTVVEKKIDPATGSETTTTRKEVRRPGAGGSGGAPYPDGTELKGKDGKVYVVTGGQPVLKEQATAKPATPSAKPATPSLIDRAGAERLTYLQQLKASGRITPGDQAELDRRLADQ